MCSLTKKMGNEAALSFSVLLSAALIDLATAPETINNPPLGAQYNTSDPPRVGHVIQSLKITSECVLIYNANHSYFNFGY